MVHMMDYGIYPGSMMIYGFIFWILAIVIVVFMLKWLINDQETGKNGAEETLRERFARDEISEEKFKEKLQVVEDEGK